MDALDIFKALLNYGVLGILVFVFGYALIRMQRKVEVLYERQIDREKVHQESLSRLTASYEETCKSFDTHLEFMTRLIGKGGSP